MESFYMKERKDTKMRAKDGRLLSIKEVLLQTQPAWNESPDNVIDSLRAISENEPRSEEETRLDDETEPDFAVRSAA